MLVSSTYQPVGKVTHVEGGFRLSGRWGFSTGSVHCGWVLLGAFCPPKDDGTPAEMRTFLLPRSDYTIDEDAWHVSACRAPAATTSSLMTCSFPNTAPTVRSTASSAKSRSGSEHRAALHPAMGAGLRPLGLDRSFWRGPSGDQCRHGDMHAPRFDQYRQGIEADPILLPRWPGRLPRKGEMETTLRLTFDDLMGYAERGEAIPMEKRASMPTSPATVVRRLADLVDDIVQLLGGRAIYMTSDIIQPWLDLNAGRAHVANDPATTAPAMRHRCWAKRRSIHSCRGYS
jgi:3-hydroxy-9,10-secoandrosta-1,3,5(10)-triene-9,17-dione monooxygenase